MLASVSSKELSRWMAYETVSGPVGNGWRDDTLALIAELMQQNNYLTGAQCEENPVPKPQPVPRPWELAQYYKDHQYDDEPG